MTELNSTTASVGLGAFALSLAPVTELLQLLTAFLAFLIAILTLVGKIRAGRKEK